MVGGPQGAFLAQPDDSPAFDFGKGEAGVSAADIDGDDLGHLACSMLRC
jgi:hypothetical protein